MTVAEVEPIELASTVTSWDPPPVDASWLASVEVHPGMGEVVTAVLETGFSVVSAWRAGDLGGALGALGLTVLVGGAMLDVTVGPAAVGPAAVVKAVVDGKDGCVVVVADELVVVPVPTDRLGPPEQAARTTATTTTTPTTTVTGTCRSRPIGLTFSPQPLFAARAGRRSYAR